MRSRHIVFAVAVVAALGLLAMGIFLIRRTVLSRSRQRTSQSWADARACLLGPPLEPDETVAERAFRIRSSRPAVAAKAAPRTTRSPPPPRPHWPTWCLEDVLALAERRGEIAELPERAMKLADHLQAVESSRDSPKPIDFDVRLLDDLVATASSLDPLPPTEGHMTAELSPRPMVDDVALARIFDRFHGYSSVYVNGHDRQPFDAIKLRGLRQQSCVVEAFDGKPLARMSCTGESEAPFEQVFVAADGARYQFVSVAATKTKTGVTVHKTGKTIIVASPERTRLERVHDGKVEPLLTFDGWAHQALIADGRVVWPEGHRWMTRTIRTEAPWLSDPAELAEGEGLIAASCRAPSSTLLTLSRVRLGGRGGIDTTGRTGFELFFPRGDGFSPPVPLPWESPGQGRSLRGSEGSRILSCSDRDARIAGARSTWDDDLVDDTVASRWICTTEGCREEHTRLGRLALDEVFYGGNSTDEPDGLEPPYVVDLGPRTLVLWRSNGAIWARLAPFAELGTAPDRVILGDDSRFRISWGQDPVITRDGVALAFLQIGEKDEEAVLTVRADAAGDLRVLLPRGVKH